MGMQQGGESAHARVHHQGGIVVNRLGSKDRKHDRRSLLTRASARCHLQARDCHQFDLVFPVAAPDVFAIYAALQIWIRTRWGFNSTGRDGRE